ncbi:hypothetical protein [Hymenobacter sedentarius]|uniref:hypothetical protein n=1 Tax=Hymenobacter sedentarius TaxID=1411621 RepID=UPI000B0C9E26|nr:hypothetical protein [Hymenobacter sedentarius]
MGKDKKPVTPLLTKHRIHTSTNKFQFVVAKELAKAAVDPYHELTDRVLEDNAKDIKL